MKENDLTEIKYPDQPILIIDDDQNDLDSIEIILESEKITNIITCSDSRKANFLIKEKNIGLLLVDLMMPHVGGEMILQEVRKNHPNIPIIIFTGLDEAEKAVSCIKQGAYDYLVKPVERRKLITTIKNALMYCELSRENLSLRNHLLHSSNENHPAFKNIITQNKQMFSIFNYLEAISKSPFQVLINGETGTGKELIAQSIHALSGRQGQLVTVNVSSVYENVFADTLFGHRKGAFTDARDVRQGLIKKAENGVILFDEIGDLSPTLQAVLLRLIQEKEYYALGSDVPEKTNAKIITSTNVDLKAAVEKGTFRKDLYYRLMQHHVSLPPLRERLDDIPVLTEYFIHEASAEINKKTPSYPKELLTILSNYDYPGNIRELKNIIFDAVNTHTSKVLSLDSFRKLIRSDKNISIPEDSTDSLPSLFDKINMLPSLKELEASLIKQALKRTNNNKSQAASLIGLSRRSLIRKTQENGD